jgi:hypothetical protein
MSGTMTELVDTSMFDRRHQRRPQNVHMSYSDIERSSGSPLTQSQNNSQDFASVDTTIASNVSCQETNDSSMNKTATFGHNGMFSLREAFLS